MKNCERAVQRKEYKRYSKSRIRKLLYEIYGIKMVDVDYGYKSNRYIRFCQYNLYLEETNELIGEHVTLAALGDYLTSKGDY